MYLGEKILKNSLGIYLISIYLIKGNLSYLFLHYYLICRLAGVLLALRFQLYHLMVGSAAAPPLHSGWGLGALGRTPCQKIIELGTHKLNRGWDGGVPCRLGLRPSLSPTQKIFLYQCQAVAYAAAENI